MSGIAWKCWGMLGIGGACREVLALCWDVMGCVGECCGVLGSAGDCWEVLAFCRGVLGCVGACKGVLEGDCWEVWSFVTHSRPFPLANCHAATSSGSPTHLCTVRARLQCSPPVSGAHCDPTTLPGVALPLCSDGLVLMTTELTVVHDGGATKVSGAQWSTDGGQRSLE